MADWTEDEVEALLDAVSYQRQISEQVDRRQYLEVWVPLENKLKRLLVELQSEGVAQKQ
jgi:hypothetical protein